MRQTGFTALLVACALVGGTAAGRLNGERAATARQAAAPTGEMPLGSVTIPRRVLADGQPLPAGTYQLRLTGDSAAPDVPGQEPVLNRWVEFRQGDEVKGREIASIVPPDEIADVAGSALPRPGTARVQMLKDNEYLRIWINHGGTHYLLHLPPA